MLTAPRRALSCLAFLLISACGDDDGTTNPPVTDPDTTATALSIISGDGQTGEVGTTLPVTLGVGVSNAGGDPLLGKTVSWTVESGGGSLAVSTSGTNAQGESTNAYTLGMTAGPNTVRASVDGTALTTTFTATGTPVVVLDTVPASIEIVSGNGQSAVVGEVLDSALIVKVRNAAGDSLVSAVTDWAVTAGDGTLLQDQVNSNVGGEIINIYTVSSSPRTDSIEVMVSSNPSLKVTFIATATSPPATAAVAVTDNAFAPDEVLVATGGSVTWNWGGSNDHDVTWVAGGLTNSTTQSAGSHLVTFSSAGSFDYYCTIHGSPTAGMRGKVEVKD
jgi:plastocyanin